MTNTATNVATIQTSGQDPIEAALDAAIAELENLDANRHTTADLIDAREQYREQQRQQQQSRRIRFVMPSGSPRLR